VSHALRFMAFIIERWVGDHLYMSQFDIVNFFHGQYRICHFFLFDTNNNNNNMIRFKKMLKVGDFENYIDEPSKTETCCAPFVVKGFL
jgi:hypothetical protein